MIFELTLDSLELPKLDFITETQELTQVLWLSGNFQKHTFLAPRIPLPLFQEISLATVCCPSGPEALSEWSHAT